MAGDYAVVKLAPLAAKYGAWATRTIEIISTAENAGKIVLNEIDAVLASEKIVIKETNGTIISTIKKEEEILDGATVPDKQIVITEAANVMDGTALNNLTPELPNTRNISKGKLHKSSHKIDPGVNTELQTKVNDIIANGDNTGTKTEQIQDKLFTEKAGFNNPPLDAKYGPNNNPVGDDGIDGLYIKGTISNPTEIVISEAKQWDGVGGVTLNDGNTSTGLPIQMSDSWIQHVAQKLIQTGDANKIAIGNMLQNPANANIIQKYLTVVNKSTGDINVLKLGTY